jgi:putative cell wall-binding protein
MFPDALSVAPVAALDHAPLLLVRPDAVPPSVADEIRRLNPQRIVVAGGPAAVSDVAFAQLQALVKDTIRVGGKDRYETSRLIARYGMDVAKVFPAGATANAFVATGLDFPDALTAGGVAGLEAVDAPVILVRGTSSGMTPETIALFDALGTKKAVVTGGTGAVSRALMDSIPSAYAPVRVSGADRYATSEAIVDTFRVPVASPGPLATEGVLATGQNFPDALAGAAYVAASGSTLWVVPPSCVPNPVLATGKTLKLDLYALLGGTAALGAPEDTLTTCK